MAVFHSISAFCNAAGFDILGTKTHTNLLHYRLQEMADQYNDYAINHHRIGWIAWEDIYLNRFQEEIPVAE